jgi:aspartate/methionine/tyrosine aminotransferase
LTGKPAIILPTNEKFYPDPKQLQKLLEEDDSIAIVVINSPNNPTGSTLFIS